MKSYLEIPGFAGAPYENCIAFYKYDGSNVRAEWSRKTGWYKFGSRSVLIDRKSELGPSIDLFLGTYGDAIAKVFTDNPKFKKVESAVAYCEYFGPQSFAGLHHPTEPKEVMLIDVNIHKKGFMLPDDFVATFGHLKIAEVVYRGMFDRQFVYDIVAGEGKYSHLKEGIVAKGIDPKAKNPQHSLWMAKVKTLRWLNELKKKAEIDTRFKSALTDNMKEQGYVA